MGEITAEKEIERYRGRERAETEGDGRKKKDDFSPFVSELSS